MPRPSEHIQTSERHAPPIFLIGGAALRAQPPEVLEQIGDALQTHVAGLLEDGDVHVVQGYDITPEPAGYENPGPGLHRMRRILGLTQAALAKAIGYGVHAVGLIEGGHRYPRHGYVTRTAARGGFVAKTVFVQQTSEPVEPRGDLDGPDPTAYTQT